jgi:hypothetical protein
VNLTVSPQIRIVAAVGLLAAVGFGASTMLLGHSSSKRETVAVSTQAVSTVSKPAVHRHATAPTPAKHVTHAKPVTHKHAVTPTAAKHATKPATAAKPAKPAKPAKFYGNPVYANLPAPLQWQLAHHKVVVVSIYNPQSDVDSISVAEAHQGAVDAKAGFLLVNVLDNKVAGILTALLPGGGLLPDPGVLVYRAPGDIALRLDGFADRDTVAQAATNALNGESGPVTDTTATPTTTDPLAAAAAAAAPATTTP